MKTTAYTLGNGGCVVVRLRYDDKCKNGHNTFSITGEHWKSPKYYETHKRTGSERGLLSLGCIHELIARTPYAPLIHWHMVSDDGPTHYIENTLYWLGYLTEPDVYRHSPDWAIPNITLARRIACWLDMPESLICDPDVRMLAGARNAAAEPVKAVLLERLPALMVEFHAAMAAITWDTEEKK